MYDPISAKLLASAPSLSGINNDSLPQFITSAYLNLMLVKTRMAQRPEDADGTVQELKSISMAQESLAILLPEGDLRRSAAYVAATAYKMLQETLEPRQDELEALTVHSISPLIAASLLFMCADAPAEALEVTKALETISEQRYKSLYTLIVALPNSLDNMSVQDDSPLDMSSKDPNQIVADIGYKQCLTVTRDLVDYLTGETSTAPRVDRYREISEDMRFSFEPDQRGDRVDDEIVILGPWKLARLLELAAKSMLSSATIAIQPPDGVEEARWRDALKPIAMHRPLLWGNHLDAIARGFLNFDVSSVVTFPTGAGKSTLSELKILTCTLTSRNVVYLVPTHALADQVSDTLKHRFNNANISSSDRIIDSESNANPDIFVLTPESCLAQLSRDSGAFGRVGLVVFDEAHLIHSDDGKANRRSIDATLSLIKLLEAFPETDIMLASAMISNGAEIADWLTAITGKYVLNLNHQWKPTQQVSGALVYPEHEVSSLQAMLSSMILAYEGSAIPAEAKRSMLARPHALFSLKPRWDALNSSNYKLLRLLDTPLLLGVSKNDDGTAWWPTANANKVSAKIAGLAGANGVKTLVFAPTIPFVNSICKSGEFSNFEPVTLIEKELRLLRSCLRTLGSEEALYIKQEDGILSSGAIPHHSLLLRDERLLHESLYKRDGGVSVLVATSTVAQGVNFPSEFVVVAGDKRFDPDRAQRSALRAHELLNAAGRGGRAGQRSAAMFLIVPGDVVTFGDGRMSSKWDRLQSVFAQGDQCLSVNDPLVQLAESGANESENGLYQYLVRRIHEVSDLADKGRIFKMSLSAFKKRREGDAADLDRFIESLYEEDSFENVDKWVRDCVSATGISSELFEFLEPHLDDLSRPESDIDSLFDSVFDIFAAPNAPFGDVLEVVRTDSFMRRATMDADDASIQVPLSNLDRQLARMWMRGRSLLEMQRFAIENGLSSSSNPSADLNRHLVYARKFVLNRIPDLAYLFSLPAIAVKARSIARFGEVIDGMIPLERVPICMERGVDSSEKLDALLSDRSMSRETAHDRFA